MCNLKMERLDKILSSQGVCSRKEIKELLKNKKIKINGAFAAKSDMKINPEHDIIEIDGVVLPYRKFLYIMMNKPSGVLSASRDKNTPTVIDLIPDNLRRRNLFPAGRLDKDTTGLLIITDDGNFAHDMLSPKKHVYKLYEAELDGDFNDAKKNILESGITLSDGTVFKPAKIHSDFNNNPRIVHIEICEGKFHQVKRMFEYVGLSVINLKRLRIGMLNLDKNLAPGECRLLTDEELTLIFNGHSD